MAVLGEVRHWGGFDNSKVQAISSSWRTSCNVSASAPVHACLPDTKFSIGSHDSSSETINPNNSSINCLGHVISVPCHSNKKVTNPSTWEEKADGSL